MKTVLVIVSTYNGEKYIARQLDTILAQKNVNVKIFIRDDCSTDNTVKTINAYIKEHPYNDIRYIAGDNKGYAKSFWDALCLCGEADYYAFSDQDDIWDHNKLNKCIKVMNRDKTSIELPQLAYCRMRRCDSSLIPLKEQVPLLTPQQLTKKLVLTQTFNYGASSVINASARNIVCRCWPKCGKMPHDAWIGLLCYWFGKVYFVDEALYDWIRYETSVTGAGTRLSGKIFRIKETLKGNSYANVSEELLTYYNDLLAEQDITFLNSMKNYKNNIVDKIKLLLDFGFKRSSIQGTIMLKIGVLLNKL